LWRLSDITVNEITDSSLAAACSHKKAPAEGRGAAAVVANFVTDFVNFVANFVNFVANLVTNFVTNLVALLIRPAAGVAGAVSPAWG
jgi:hypothetical protein